MEVEHINHALVAKAHTPMYVMHKFWARKPHNVVREYIERYSKPGDIVLDPFVGSGVTALEALKADRKAVAVDLDPIATFITRNTGVRIDIDKIQEIFEHIKAVCKNRIEKLYTTICPKCKNKALIVYTIKENEKMIEIGYECVGCLKRQNSSKRFLVKTPDQFDFDLLKKIDQMKIPHWTPRDVRLSYDGLKFLKGERNEKLEDLFDKRALISLSILYNEIEKIKDNRIKDIFKIIFTSNVHNVSKLNPVHQPRWKKGMHPSTSWIVHSYWVPRLRVECPVWFYFEQRYKHIIEAKKDSNSQIRKYSEAKKFDDLNNGANILIKTYNALELTDIIPKNSIDYIFTDPPYGGAVQYFELSTLWASWLKMNIDYRDEITINKNQKKDFEYYHKMLKAAFGRMFLVLKPGKYLTVTFHSTDIKVWNSIVRAVILSGFELEKIVYQPPARPSAKGLLQPFGSAVGDYYIRFKKPEKENQVTEKQMDMKEYELTVVDDAMRIIGERREPTMYQHILNGIMVDLKGGRNVPIGAKSIEEILKENIGKFELIPVKNEKGTVIGKKWWVKGWDLSHFSQPTLSDRVERAIIHVLDKRIKVSFDDILQSIFIQFPNAQTPDTQNIKEILEEYAKKTKDGKWMLKPGLGEVYRKTKHSEMIYYLAVLGKKAGYDIWIGKKEQTERFGKTKLSELCDSIPAIRYVPQEEMTLSRIRNIDVLWLEDGRLRCEFEVENTTGITGAIVRGSNIPTDLRVKRFIIIPKERENLLCKRLQEPIIQQSLKKDKWDFIKYHRIRDVFDKYRSKRKFDVKELDKIAEMPKIKKQVQNNLFNYANKA